MVSLLASIIVLLLIAVPLLLLLLYELVIFAAAYLRREDAPPVGGEAPQSLEVVMPVYSEPLDLVASVSKRDFEAFSRAPCFARLTILSDDSAEYVEALSRLVSDAPGVAVWRRGERRGGRTGALDDYFASSSSSHLMILDADAVVDPGVAEKLCRNTLSDGALVVPWEGYYAYKTRLAEAVKFFTDLGTEVLYELRSRAGFYVFPLGSGTVYPRKVVLDVGGWGDGIVQDDIWMGVKLALGGYRTRLLSGSRLKVLVPSTLGAFKKQQRRWSYGTSDVLRRSFLRVLKHGGLPLHVRLEMLAYMSLPALTIPPALAVAVLPFLGLLEPRVGLGGLLTALSLALAPFVVVAPLYLYLYSKLVRVGSSLKESLVNLGRFAAIIATLVPVLALASVRGLLGLSYSFEVTPKGKKEAAEKKEALPVYLSAWFSASLAVGIVMQNSVQVLLSLLFLASSAWAYFRADGPMPELQGRITATGGGHM